LSSIQATELDASESAARDRVRHAPRRNDPVPTNNPVCVVKGCCRHAGETIQTELYACDIPTRVSEIGRRIMKRGSPTSRRRYSNTEHSTLARKMCAISVPGQRLLRSQRLAAGEIRDATTVQVDKRAVSERPRSLVSPAIVLPSGITFEQAVCPDTSPEAWSEKRSQAHSGSDGVCGEQKTLEPSLSFAQLAELVQHSSHMKVHPRSIERSFYGKKTPIGPIGLLSAYTAARLEKDGLDCRVRRAAASILNGQRDQGGRYSCDAA